jgi:hypothetical protein
MDEREDELARLLEHARNDVASADVVAEVRGKLMTSIAVDSVPSDGGASAGSAGSSAALKLALPVKLATSLAVMGAVITAFVMLDGREVAPAKSPSRVLERTPAVVVPPPAAMPEVTRGAALEPSVTVETPFVDDPAGHSKVKKRGARKPIIAPLEAAALQAAPEPSFAEELSLIKAALAAQREGRLEDARAKLVEHAQRFPEGQLTHERKRIEARLLP